MSKAKTAHTMNLEIDRGWLVCVFVALVNLSVTCVIVFANSDTKSFSEASIVVAVMVATVIATPFIIHHIKRINKELTASK